MDNIQHLKNWIKDFVVHYNLCPFAKYPYENDKIRYVVYEKEDVEEFIKILEKELKLLQNTPTEELETTILIHPNLLKDFLAYNDFLSIADNLIFALQLEGVVQIASFHPDYQFADTDKEDVTNYTNRSPYPLLHLLREESITRATEEHGHTEDIPKQNIKTLKELGLKQVKELLYEITRKD